MKKNRIKSLLEKRVEGLENQPSPHSLGSTMSPKVVASGLTCLPVFGCSMSGLPHSSLLEKDCNKNGQKAL